MKRNATPRTLLALAVVYLSTGVTSAQAEVVQRYRGEVTVAVLESGTVAVVIDETTGLDDTPDGWVDRVFTFTPKDHAQVPPVASLKHAEVALRAPGKLQITGPAFSGFLIHVAGQADKAPIIETGAAVAAFEATDLGHYWGYEGVTVGEALARLEENERDLRERLIGRRNATRSSATTEQAPLRRVTAGVCQEGESSDNGCEAGGCGVDFCGLGNCCGYPSSCTKFCGGGGQFCCSVCTLSCSGAVCKCFSESEFCNCSQPIGGG